MTTLAELETATSALQTAINTMSTVVGNNQIPISAQDALAYLNDFKGRYYGAMATVPVLDLLGNAITEGDMYFNSASNAMMVYRAGSWGSYEGAAQASAIAAAASASAAQADRLVTTSDRVSATASDVLATSKAASALSSANLAATYRNTALNAQAMSANFAEASRAASSIAISARDTAIIQAGVYATEALGRAAVADGQAFKVQGSGAVAAYEYRRVDASTSALIASYPSSEGLYSHGVNYVNHYAANVLANSYVNSANGTIGANTTYTASDFIVVEPGAWYVWSFISHLAWYNAMGVFISGGSPGVTTQQAPAGAYFARFSATSTMWTTIQMELGHLGASSVSSPFSPYFEVFTNYRLADQSIYGSLLASGVVTPDKTTFVRPRKNLFNPADSDVVLGQYVDNLGVLRASVNYNTSGYIPVVPTAVYTVSTKNRISWYNEKKQCVGGSLDTNTDPVLTVPGNARYLRCAIPTTVWSSFQVELGSVATVYDSYNVELDSAYLPSISKLETGSVTTDATNFIWSKNIVDESLVVSGFYVNMNSGNLDVHGSYRATGYVPMKPNTVYTASYANQRAFYDINKKFISGASAGTAITTPANTSYARFTVPPTGTFQVERGATATAYKAYGLGLDPALMTNLTIPVDGVGTLNLQDSSVISTKILDGSIGPSKLSFLNSKNLIVQSEIAAGFYVNATNGNLDANASYSYTGYVAVTPGVTYTRSNAFQMAFYTNAKVYISGLALSDRFAGQIVPPAGASFARFSINNSYLATFQVELGGVKTAYAPYKLTMDEALLPTFAPGVSSVSTSALQDSSVTGQKLAQNSVSVSHVTFVTTKNLADSSKFTVGSYQTWNSSAVYLNAGYTVTDYVPLSPNTVYSRSASFQTAFYDASKVYISGLSQADGAPSTFTTPANCGFARFSISNSYVAQFQVELGASPTVYAPYKLAFDTSLIALPLMTNDNLGPGIVYPQNTNFFIASKNLFSIADATPGGYVYWGSGQVYSNATYSASDYISVLPSTAYSRSHALQMAFFTDTKAFISGNSLSSNLPETFTTPANCYFVRLSVSNSIQSSFQFELGTANTTYVPYGNTIAPQYLPAASGGGGSSSSSGSTVSDMILPSITYCLVGSDASVEQTNIYFENICQGYIVDKLIDTTGAYGREYKECWRIEPGRTSIAHYNIATGSFTLSMGVYDLALTPIKTASTSIQLVDKTAVTPVRLLCIGDSITRDGTYGYKVKTTLPSITMQGIRHYDTDPAGHNREGRGGWTMAGYFSNAGLTSGWDSPFMFPTGLSGEVYRGNTAFWKSVVTVTGNYDTDGFQWIARGWLPAPNPFLYNTSGYPTNPALGWIVFDPLLAAGSKFQYYNGSAWVANATQPATWAFDMGKYFARYPEIYAAGLPTHITLLMGANDFQGGTTSTASLDAFKANVEAMIASARAAIPTVKFVINIPVLGADQNAWALSGGNGQTAEGYRLNIRNLSRYLLTNYDTPAKRTEGTYVCSMLQAVDPVNGFDSAIEAASKYTTNTIKRYNNFVHPNSNVGHMQMGDALAAVIQFTR